MIANNEIDVGCISALPGKLPSSFQPYYPEKFGNFSNLPKKISKFFNLTILKKLDKNTTQGVVGLNEKKMYKNTEHS